MSYRKKWHRVIENHIYFNIHPALPERIKGFPILTFNALCLDTKDALFHMLASVEDFVLHFHIGADIDTFLESCFI